MASGKEIRISITSALNAAGIEATKQQVAQMSKSVQQSLKDVSTSNRKHWADVKAAWDMGCAAIRTAWRGLSSVLSSAFRFETQTQQFKVLIGNIDEAKAHMADLKALGDTPPFSLDQFAKASRSLMVMTDGVLGYKRSLELIGDAAAATGYPIEELGQAVGRLYAFIRDGQPLSRAVMQLRNMGVITPEVAQKLQDLQAAGKSNAEIWAEVEAQLGRYKGAMAETEQTGDGLVTAIKTRWDNIVRAFGNALKEDAKDGLAAVNEAAKKLEEDESIAVWANRAVEALHKVKEAAKETADAIGWIWEKTGLSDAWNTGKGVVQGAAYSVTRAIYGVSQGEGWGTALSEADRGGGEWFAKSAARGHYVGKAARAGLLGGGMAWAAADNARDEAARAEKDEAVRAGVRAKKREEAAAKKKTEEERAAEEQRRIAEALAEGQRKIDEKNAKEAAEKKAAEVAKLAEKEKAAAEKAAAERERLERQEEARRERAIQKEYAERLREHQKFLAASRDEESKTRASVSAADSKLQQAWAWYRDKESMAAQIAEEKADAQARKQFEKDFERLKDRRRDWRKAENLSVDDEAVRRVALAREEKEAAERHLAEIERNTADLAAKLDELLQVKG